MNSMSLINSLNKATLKRKELSRHRFLVRILKNPRMFLITSIVSLLSNAKSTAKVRAKTFWGKRMVVVLPEVVSVDILRFGYIAEAVASAIINFIKKGSIAIDVGGHFGFFSMLMAEMVGETGEVHSFEPMPNTFSILKENSKDIKFAIKKKLPENLINRLLLDQKKLGEIKFSIKIKKHFPNAAIKKIKNSGHWLHVDSPDEFFLLITNFLRVS